MEHPPPPGLGHEAGKPGEIRGLLLGDKDHGCPDPPLPGRVQPGVAVQRTQRSLQLRHRDHQIRAAAEEAAHGSALLPVHGELGGLEGGDLHLPPGHLRQAEEALAGLVVKGGDVLRVEPEAGRRLLQAGQISVRDGDHRLPVRDDPEGPGLSVRQKRAVLAQDLRRKAGVRIAVDSLYFHGFLRFPAAATPDPGNPAGPPRSCPGSR